MLAVYKGLTVWNFQNVAVGRIDEVAALTWFSCEKIYWHGRNNEVAVRRGSTVLFQQSANSFRFVLFKAN